MSEGEHTIISKIPRERLNQIAGRKLSALAIPVRLGADRETIEGDLAFTPPLRNPFGGGPIQRARFVVAGHDHLRFVDPPLSALPPVLFYDAERTSAIEARVGELLVRRATLLHDVGARMRALAIEPVFDPRKLTVRGVVKTTHFAYEILGDDEAIRVSRVAPVGGAPFEVSLAFPPLDLNEYGSATDLELWLDGRVVEMQTAGRRTGQRQGAAKGATLVVNPPPRNALTLGVILKAFGPDGVMAPNAPVEVFQEFQHGGTRYRFVATREVGSRFRGRLIGPEGDVWSEQFDLENFSGIASVVGSALGAPAEAISVSVQPAPSEEQPAPAGGIPQHLMPRQGEVWVMNVVVEQAGDEVRYVGTDIDGRPYGAARVLKRTDFEAVFSNERGGWRLLIVIDQVQENGVVYRQLDPQRQPIGAARKMPASVLVANFVPEAAAY